MDYLRNFYELNRDKLNLFVAQDPETGDFDVVFEIGGKKLYAHKYKLLDVSTTFSTMLSDRWTSPNQPIKLETFSFDDFKEFIAFIYSGECKLDHDNISTMVDIAEFYDVKVFKKVCEDFLLKVVLGPDNIYQMLELGYKYSMENIKKLIFEYISKNLSTFIKSEQFLSLPKTMVYDVVKSNQYTLRQEGLFEMVYKWTERQESSNESIKTELCSLLPLFKFQLMNFDFLIDFVVKKSFLFSGDELSQILLGARYLITLEDGNGKMIKGILNCPNIEKVYHNVQSKKRDPSYSLDCTKKNWKLAKSIKPSEPSKLIKKPEVEWYLVCNDTEYVSIVHQSLLMNDYYLLAELTAENGFKLNSSKFV